MIKGPSGERLSAWPILILLAGLQAIAFCNRFLLAPLSTSISHQLRVDDFHMGLLQGATFILPFAISTLLFGLTVDKVSQNWSLIAGLLLMTLASVWSATAGGYGALLGARALLGVGEAAIAPAAIAHIARASAGESRGLATALFAVGGPLGKGLALTGGGALLGLCVPMATPLAPWREVLWVAAGANLLVLALAFLMLRPRRGVRPAAEAPRSAPTFPWENAPRLWATAVAGVASVMASQTAAFWGPGVFVRSFSLSPARAGVLTGAPLLLIVPACALASGWLLDRAGARARREPPVLPWLAACLGAGAALALLLRAASDVSLAQLAFGALAGALGAAAVAGLRGVQIYAEDGSRGRVCAVYVSAANLVGFGAGPPLVGWLSTAGGRGASLMTALTTALAVVCALGVASILAVALIPAHRAAGVDRRTRPTY